MKGNILDPATIKQLVEGEDVVIHLAATISINGQKVNLHDTNVTGTRNVLDAVKDSRVKRFIHFSSIHAYRHDPLDRTLDETRPLALEDHIQYNRTKAIAHRLVLDEVKNGLDALIISPTSVMGPNDFKPSLLGQAIIQLYRGKIPALIPGGYDWVDVRDVVEGTLASIEKGRTGESYLLSGHYLSLSEVFTKLTALSGKKMSLPVLPFWLARIGVPFLKAWARLTGSKPLYTRESVEILETAHKVITSDKAMKELGYSSRPFEETLEDTLGWFRDNNYL